MSIFDIFKRPARVNSAPAATGRPVITHLQTLRPGTSRSDPGPLSGLKTRTHSGGGPMAPQARRATVSDENGMLFPSSGYQLGGFRHIRTPSVPTKEEAKHAFQAARAKPQSVRQTPIEDEPILPRSEWMRTAPPPPKPEPRYTQLMRPRQGPADVGRFFFEDTIPGCRHMTSSPPATLAETPPSPESVVDSFDESDSRSFESPSLRSQKSSTWSMLTDDDDLGEDKAAPSVHAPPAAARSAAQVKFVEPPRPQRPEGAQVLGPAFSPRLRHTWVDARTFAPEGHRSPRPRDDVDNDSLKGLASSDEVKFFPEDAPASSLGSARAPAALTSPMAENNAAQVIDGSHSGIDAHDDDDDFQPLSDEDRLRFTARDSENRS